MSYEGIEEFICKNGHYSHCDAHDYISGKPILKCPFCGAPFAYTHSVNETNGTLPPDRDPHYFTARAPKYETGYIDIWQADHYGNKYAVKVVTWRPDVRYWRQLVLNDAPAYEAQPA